MTTALGPALPVDRARPDGPHRSGPRGRRVLGAPWVVSRVTGSLGVLSLVDALWPVHARDLHVTTLLPWAGVQAWVAVSGVLLLRVAAGLRRRKRAEWCLAVTVCVSLLIASLVREDRRPVEAAVTLALLAALLASRSQFRAQADPTGRGFAVRVGLQFAAAGTVVGMAMLAIPGHVVGPASLGRRLQEVGWALFGATGPLTLNGRHFVDLFASTLLGFGLLALASTIVLLLRTTQPTASLPAADEQALRGLLARHGGRDSLGYFTLRRDKSVVWSPSGKAAISYRVVCGVALVSGDPVGDPEAWSGVIRAYRELVERHGWTPAVTGCSELGAVAFRRDAGLTALALGDEAILSAAGFTLDGREMRGVRHACGRVARAGYDIQVRRVSGLTPSELGELQAAADRWREDTVERGFSMALSRLGDPDDGHCVVCVARQDGQLRGLLHFVPWGPDGLSLDLMRRDRGADNGVNEAMVTAVMRSCPDLGVERVSLNFAVFRDILDRGRRIGAGPVLRLCRRVLLVASRFWQIESLYRFNDKFRPSWQPRYLSYAGARDLPRITLAVLEAEGFLVRPALLGRVLGRR